MDSPSEQLRQILTRLGGGEVGGVDFDKIQQLLAQATGRYHTFQWFDHVSLICTANGLSTADRDKLLDLFAAYGTERVKITHIIYAVVQLKLDNPEDDVVPVDGAVGDKKTYLELVTLKMLENEPFLIGRPNPSDPNDSVLSVAVLNQAHWLIPDDVEKLGRDDRRKLKEALSQGQPSNTPLDKAITQGHAVIVRKIVKLLKIFGLDQSHRGDLLSKAIQNQDITIVKLLVDEYPEIVEQISDGRSALQVLRDLPPFQQKQAMSDLLTSKIIRRKNPALVQKLLYDRTNKAEELYVDLSLFNDGVHSFDRFLESVKANMFNIDFSPILIYIQFPRLPKSAMNSDRQEAFTILNWLHREKGVHSILDLHVPDALEGPHLERDIETCLQQFDIIEALNWQLMDMSLETIRNVKGLKKLWLYCSGNRDVLNYWTGSEGIVGLQVEEVEIQIIEGRVSFERAKKSAEEAMRRLEKQMETRKFRFQVYAAKWDERDEIPGSYSPSGSPEKTAEVATGLSNFLQTFRNFKIAEPVRVAIIDNGVDRSIGALSMCIEKGKSFVEFSTEDGDRESPWWLASDPHGTQMASIIHELDPLCKLYVAKVGTSRGEILNRDYIKRAIKWAIEEEVDIISLSMTLSDQDDDFRSAVKTASDQQIVFFCSTEDVGSSGGDVYPAGWKEYTIAISGVDSGGKEIRATDKRAKFYFISEQIAADGLSYCPCAKTVGGSSVATAIAAGSASLVLSCRKWANKGSKKGRKETVESAFADMKEANDKYVRPGNLFKEEAKGGKRKYSSDDWENFLHVRFGPMSAYT